MSKGPGKVQRAIAARLAEHPGYVFTVDDLASRIYGQWLCDHLRAAGDPNWRIASLDIEKKHRVAVIRALETMDLGDWQIFYERSHFNQLVIWNRADARSRATWDFGRDPDAGRYDLEICLTQVTIYTSQMIEAIRQTNAYLAETGRPPFNLKAIEAQENAARIAKGYPPLEVTFSHWHKDDARKRVALAAEAVELMEGIADAVPAADREPDEMDRLAALITKADVDHAEQHKAAELAAAIALVEAAGMTVVRPGHNGGPNLDAAA